MRFGGDCLDNRAGAISCNDNHRRLGHQTDFHQTRVDQTLGGGRTTNRQAQTGQDRAGSGTGRHFILVEEKEEG